MEGVSVGNLQKFANWFNKPSLIYDNDKPLAEYFDCSFCKPIDAFSRTVGVVDADGAAFAVRPSDFCARHRVYSLTTKNYHLRRILVLFHTAGLAQTQS